MLNLHIYGLAEDQWLLLCNTKMTKYSAEFHYPESHNATCSGAMIFSIMTLTKQNDLWIYTARQ